MSDNPIPDKERFIKRVLELGDIIQDDSGYYVYWPQKQSYCLMDYHLQWLAEQIREMNAEWDTQVTDAVSQLPNDDDEPPAF